MPYRKDLDLATEEEIPTGWERTSIESRDRLEKKKNRYREKIYWRILHTGGMTCDEVEIALGLRHQTASCFIRFLTQDGLLYKSTLPNGETETRITRSGRSAIVWKARLAPVKVEDPQKNLFDN